MESPGSFLQGGDEDFYQKLLFQAAQEEGQIPQTPAAPCHKVTPKPGFCLKTKNEKGEKVFINVCVEESLPIPKDITDTELVKILDSPDPSSYRVPMSLGEPHAEVDKSGAGCAVYDIVVHPSFLGKVKASELFMGFFLTVVLEGLEYKYEMQLDRNWVILKNRRFMGNIQQQMVRSEAKPWIMDMDDPGSAPGMNKPGGQGNPLISEVTSCKEDMKPTSAAQPKYTIVQEPTEGHPEFLVAEFQLQKVKTAASMSLDIGEDRILLKTRSNAYYLDIYLPYDLVQEECGAQFNQNTKVLTVTMPVVSCS
ncbi:PIH1 domain-containing protein 1-like [Lineus longissimus]|uniref:PIH1 domain-containing protein 1-like n=1 Tax=Lineus longissimus TaxID=88925 RepID=UPI002B4C9FCD